MASSSSFWYWFFRDVGFMRKASTGVYFAAKPWLAMAVVVYSGAHLLEYKMQRTGHLPVEDKRMPWAGYDSAEPAALPIGALRDDVDVPTQLAAAAAAHAHDRH